MGDREQTRAAFFQIAELWEGEQWCHSGAKNAWHNGEDLTKLLLNSCVTKLNQLKLLTKRISNPVFNDVEIAESLLVCLCVKGCLHEMMSVCVYMCKYVF